jgi:hypothetical protein
MAFAFTRFVVTFPIITFLATDYMATAIASFVAAFATVAAFVLGYFALWSHILIFILVCPIHETIET